MKKHEIGQLHLGTTKVGHLIFQHKNALLYRLQSHLLSLDTMDSYGQRISRLIGQKVNQTMIHTLTLLTVLRLLSDAKLTCHRGFVTYERIPNHKLVGFEEKVVSNKAEINN